MEINYLLEGSITYLFHGNSITLPSQRLAIFWGLVPHQIVSREGDKPYYVCTIPFPTFLELSLPAFFVDRLLNGEVLIEANEKPSIYDEYLMNNWIEDINNNKNVEVALLEMHARLRRMANRNLSENVKRKLPIHLNEISHVERIAVYIAKNYQKPIKVSDIGEAVELHLDYANSIFKKTFGSTMSEYIIEERISHAKRKLLSTDMSITEIGFDCGFNSIGRFNAAFQKINGCTPRAFRKKYL